MGFERFCGAARRCGLVIAGFRGWALVVCVVGVTTAVAAGASPEATGERWQAGHMRSQYRSVLAVPTRAPELRGEAGYKGLEGEAAATPRTVEVGQLSINVPTPRRYGKKGSVDRIYKFEPVGETQSYNRGKIANFLYKLEAENRRVKVTSLSISPFNKRSRLKPGVIGDDSWTSTTNRAPRPRACSRSRPSHRRLSSAVVRRLDPSGTAKSTG